MATSLVKHRPFLLGLCFVLYMTLTFTYGATKSWNNSWKGRAFRDQRRSSRRDEHRSEKPNIILIITDDQDEMFGSMESMTKTMKIMGQEGVRFNNSFVSTPMCCPSRSSLLTGMYPHNHHVYTNNENCSGTEWQQTHEPRTFAKYLSDAGYRTGFFGKYLNEYNGTYIPPGWREWVGLVRNTRFYNYTLNFNGQKVKHDDNYYADYFTDLIANDSVTFLRQSKQYFPDKPVMMMLSVPAPHGPEDSAPQYQHMFQNNTWHRTPSWNYMNNSDKQWLLQEMKPMMPIGMSFTDILQQKRLQTLQSVDSLVEKVYYTLRQLGEIDNTYMIFTSDHGYHLGQFGIVKGKALPYDFDIRVPLFIRGPGVLKDTKIPNTVGNADLAPTILDMAGIDVPDHMDGLSLMKVIKTHKQINNLEGKWVETKRPWRHTFLVERGKVTRKMQLSFERKHDTKVLEDHEDELMPFAHPKLRRLLRICKDPANHPPCKLNQKWVCFKDQRGRKRMKKCRNYNQTNTFDNTLADGFQLPLTKREQTRQTFLRDISPYDSSSRSTTGKKCDCSQKYETRSQLKYANSYEGHMEESGVGSTSDAYRRYKRNAEMSSFEREYELRKNLIAQQLDFNRQRCRFFPNNTFACDHDIIEDPKKWQSHKERLKEMIAETRKRLRNLKKIRKNMKKQKKTMRKNFDKYSVVIPEEDEEDVEERHHYTQTPNEKCDCDYPDSETDGDIEIPPELSYPDSSEEEDFENTQDSSIFTVRRNKKGKMKLDCNHDHLKCTVQSNDHWATPPYWTYGKFCYCTNAETNTYWCLRTVNTTHNFLYCEFIDSFLNYYDFNTDPHQLHNQIKSLNYGVINQLHTELERLRRCKGWKECTKLYHDDKQRKRRRRRRIHHENRDASLRRKHIRRQHKS